MFITSYFSAFVMLILVFLVSLVVFFLSFVLGYQSMNDEKNSIYECGFIPFGDARNKFEVKFYLVSILFIVFDLEIVFLLPYVAELSKLGLVNIIWAFIFLLLVALGFAYEWLSGSMNW